jgi:TetR/AcrR family fatty acid metabolism transcriptional regulator
MDLVLAMTTHLPAADADAERPDKYSRILEAAKHLYAEKGFKKATMLEVASPAGVAEGTIYEYFKNKQDLLLSITKNYFGNLKHNLDNAFAIDHPAEKLRWLMWRHFTLFAGDRELVSVFLKETKLKKYFYEDEANEVFVRYHDKICEVLEEGIEVGVFRPEINTRVFRNLVMGALAACYNRWYFRKPVYALDYMTELHQFIDLICSAATAPPTAAGYDRRLYNRSCRPPPHKRQPLRQPGVHMHRRYGWMGRGSGRCRCLLWAKPRRKSRPTPYPPRARPRGRRILAPSRHRASIGLQ